MNAEQIQQMQEQINLLQVQEAAAQHARKSRDQAAQVIYQSAGYDQLVNIGCSRTPPAGIAQDVVAALGRGNYTQAQTLLRQLQQELAPGQSPTQD